MLTAVEITTPVAGRHASRVFLHNRYHDPTLGRFISVDPLAATTGSAYGIRLEQSGQPVGPVRVV
jgi:hypothetical protein